MEKIIYAVMTQESCFYDYAPTIEKDCEGYFFKREDAWKVLEETFDKMCKNVNYYTDGEGRTIKNVDNKNGFATCENIGEDGLSWFVEVWVKEITVK